MHRMESERLHRWPSILPRKPSRTYSSTLYVVQSPRAVTRILREYPACCNKQGTRTTSGEQMPRGFSFWTSRFQLKTRNCTPSRFSHGGYKSKTALKTFQIPHFAPLLTTNISTANYWNSIKEVPTLCYSSRITRKVSQFAVVVWHLIF